MGIERAVHYDNVWLTLEPGDTVKIIHHIEHDYNEALPLDELLSAEDNDKIKRGPNYSVNNDTTYYVGCGIVTVVYKNTCNVKYYAK